MILLAQDFWAIMYQVNTKHPGEQNDAKHSGCIKCVQSLVTFFIWIHTNTFIWSLDFCWTAFRGLEFPLQTSQFMNSVYCTGLVEYYHLVAAGRYDVYSEQSGLSTQCSEINTPHPTHPHPPKKGPEDCPELKCTRLLQWHFKSERKWWSLKPQPEFRKWAEITAN